MILALGDITFAEAEWETVQPPLSLEYPRDHGSHPEYQTEWWYFTGIASTAEGRRFGFQYTIFRRGVLPPSDTEVRPAMFPDQIYFAHLAIADIRNGEFRHAERVRRGAGNLAGASTGDMHAWIENWEIKRDAGDIVTIDAFDREEQIGLDLTLKPKKPLVYQGIDGYSQKGDNPENASAYVSWTRIEANGTVQWEGQQFEVMGEAWFDHEYGTSQLGEGVVGWDWFSIRLDDGRELMIYNLRQDDGSPAPQSSGTLVNEDGSTRHLQQADFEIESLDRWKSPNSGATYPSRWRITVPSADLDLQVRTLIENAELDVRQSAGTQYWEGPIAISGSANGEGYVELTGYTHSMETRF